LHRVSKIENKPENNIRKDKKETSHFCDRSGDGKQANPGEGH
tara:strand:+ start:201 stop:326 length:126 start_codon:yes stop_codon:yes gene_type:complete